MEDAVLIKFMTEQSNSVGAIKMQLDDMSKRLFGNGQPGVLHYLAEQTKELATKTTESVSGVDKRVLALENGRTMARRWLAGAVAVITAEATIIGVFFKVFTVKITPLFDILKAHK